MFVILSVCMFQHLSLFSTNACHAECSKNRSHDANSRFPISGFAAVFCPWYHAFKSYFVKMACPQTFALDMMILAQVALWRCRVI